MLKFSKIIVSNFVCIKYCILHVSPCRYQGFSLRILIAGERWNVAGELYFLKGLHIWVKNSYRLLTISRRILCSKQRILQSPMPTPCCIQYIYTASVQNCIISNCHIPLSNIDVGFTIIAIIIIKCSYERPLNLTTKIKTCTAYSVHNRTCSCICCW